MPPPLFITDKVGLTPDILPAGYPIRRIRGVDEIPTDDHNVVAVLTLPEAESVLARAADGYPVVLWREGFADGIDGMDAGGRATQGGCRGEGRRRGMS